MKACFLKARDNFDRKLHTSKRKYTLMSCLIRKILKKISKNIRHLSILKHENDHLDVRRGQFKKRFRSNSRTIVVDYTTLNTILTINTLKNIF